jgi:hypothetical protein
VVSQIGDPHRFVTWSPTQPIANGSRLDDIKAVESRSGTERMLSPVLFQTAHFNVPPD